MLTVSEAQDAIIAAIRPATDTETVPLSHSPGRYLARAVTARSAHPAFTNSSMDGYALQAEASREGGRLRVLGESKAGKAPERLEAGTAMRIFTGAPVPAGADAIIPQEQVVREGGEIVLSAAVTPGANIRHLGEDLRIGEALYGPGVRLRPWDLSVLATAGIEEVTVWKKPRVAVLATGDELVAPGTPLKPGQIYESNRWATLSTLQDLGAVVTDGGIVPDTRAALSEALARYGSYDFVITSGGASVGDYDFVHELLGQAGTIAFWKVKVKPGKPLAFGRLHQGAHFFGLPGNPVSSLVTFRVFFEPALAAWHHGAQPLPAVSALATHAFTRQAGRTEFVRARLRSVEGQLRVTVIGGQGSHQVGPLAQTNALVRMAEDEASFDAGATLTVIPLTLDFC